MTYYGKFCYLNCSCIRKKYCFNVYEFFERINSSFCSKSRWQMFLLVSDRHVGAYRDGHQHGVSIQSSTNLRKTFLLISRIWNIAECCDLNPGEVLAYLPPSISQIRDFFYWTVLIFILIYFERLDTENQQLRNSGRLYSRLMAVFVMSRYTIDLSRLN